MAQQKNQRASDQVFIAKDSFVTTLRDGSEVSVQAGITRVRDGHELLEGRSHLFEELTVQFDLERATAAPGERRGTPQ